MSRDFVEMLSALSEAGARFLIVGARPAQPVTWTSGSRRRPKTPRA
jgi:hypothetical protein